MGPKSLFFWYVLILKIDGTGRSFNFWWFLKKNKKNGVFEGCRDKTDTFLNVLYLRICGIDVPFNLGLFRKKNLKKFENFWLFRDVGRTRKCFESTMTWWFLDYELWLDLCIWGAVFSVFSNIVGYGFVGDTTILHGATKQKNFFGITFTAFK